MNLKQTKEKIMNIKYDNIPQLYNKCEQIFNNSIIKQQKEEYILITQFDGIGDAVLLSGVIKEIKNWYNKPQ